MNAPVLTVYISSFAPVAGLKDLAVVRLTASARDDEGRLIEAGTRGTIVATYADGAAFEVEFTEPVEALATVEAENLERAAAE